MKLSTETREGDRFWYWRGASGSSYIHSIYGMDNCPPLPGAVYVMVRKLRGMRIALTAGRFPAFWEGTGKTAFGELAAHIGPDEIHVHLLARCGAAADGICRDLEAALREEPQPSLAAA